MLRSRLVDRPTGSEDGVAMVVVLGVGSLLALLLVAMVGFSLGGVRASRSDQDWNAALAAAYAGVEEYQSRLAEDPAYWQFGNPASTFRQAGPTTVTLPTGASVNPAFGVGATGTWAGVSGSAGRARFRYEIDNSTYPTDGRVRVRATGLVGGKTRSIVADLAQTGFIDFLYFTDYEIVDPAVSGVAANCVAYAWATRPSVGCGDIAFGNNDVLSGPVHSNDSLRVCNATFQDTVSTSYDPVSGPRYVARDSSFTPCTGASFTVAGTPVFAPVVGMPVTNSRLRRETRSDLTSLGVPNPGCLYTGPTSIIFNPTGTVTVRSPFTRKTNTAGDTASSGTTPARCGAVGTAPGQLGSAAGATFPVVADNVMYVQNVPTVSSDTNYTATGSVPAGFACTAANGTSPGNGLGYPIIDEYVASVSASYGCRNGDVFVAGALSGKVTVATENNLYVTGDLTVVAPEQDMLGLIGNGSVVVWNPVKVNGSTSTNLLTDTNRRIDAAILSVLHSFTVQNFARGSGRGTLTVNGAIAQKFRGIVAASTSSGSVSGYVKNYRYNSRFAYTAPPKFLSPVTSSFGVKVWIEVSPAFDTAGTSR